MIWIEMNVYFVVLSYFFVPMAQLSLLKSSYYVGTAVSILSNINKIYSIRV